MLDVGVAAGSGRSVVVAVGGGRLGVRVGQFPVNVPFQEPGVLAVSQKVLAPLLSRVERRQVRSDHGQLSHFPGNGVQVDLVWGSATDTEVMFFLSFKLQTRFDL